MATLSARHPHLRAGGRERAIGGQRVGKKRLLQPQNTGPLEGGNASGCTSHILREDLASIDQDLGIIAHAGARCLHMGCILLDRAATIIHPAELDGAEPSLARRLGKGLGFLGRLTEELRGVSKLRRRRLVAEQTINRLVEALPECIP